jgi:DNA-binding LacI/PurR family transcriptional regulator
VARAAGVDLSTVSRALSDSPRVKEETKKLIRKIAKKLGYHPHPIARSLATKVTNIIGLAYATSAHSLAEDQILSQVLESSYDALHDKGYKLLFTTFECSPKTAFPADLFDDVGSLCDGMLFCPVVYNRREFVQISNYLVVVIGMLAPEIPCVGPALDRDVAMILRRLIARGHERVCLLTSEPEPYCTPEFRYSILQATKTYEQQVQRAKKESLVLRYDSSWGLKDFGQRLKALGPVDSMFWVTEPSDEQYRWLATLYRDGVIETTDDFEMIARRDYDKSLQENPPFSFTEVMTDWHEIARRGVEKVVARVEGKEDALWDRVDMKIEDKFSAKRGLFANE